MDNSSWIRIQLLAASCRSQESAVQAREVPETTLVEPEVEEKAELEAEVPSGAGYLLELKVT